MQKVQRAGDMHANLHPYIAAGHALQVYSVFYGEVDCAVKC